MRKLSIFFVMALAIIAAAMFTTQTATAQSITSGDITGTVTDPTGAVLPNVPVTLKNAAAGTTQTANTSSQGTYRFALLPPARYNVSVAPAGFQVTQRSVEVLVGQALTVNIQVAVASATQSVEVSEGAAVVQTENADISTTFTAMQIAELPNPGNDTTYIALTAPGVVSNTGGGYGNFSTFGLPGTANLFTTNGQNNMDPYFNLNNSGATNLALGKNEVAEASVINNGYSGQYGQLAGSQVNTVTKSGTNQFHGNGVWYWAGSKLAANDFFANQAGNPKTFFNDNQWADSIGGPIWKDKTFFFFNNEGIRIVLPAAASIVKIPSPQFESATLANLTATGQTAAVPFYQKAFNLYNNAVGLKGSTAVPVSPNGGCGTGTAAFTKLGAGVPCALQFRQQDTTFTHERIWSLRIDQQIGKNDHLFGRYYDDNGLQATGTDPISPAFNAFSPQPAYQGQLSETHTFGTTAVNQFLFSGFYYSAIFGQTDYKAAQATFPAQLGFTGGFFTTLAPIGAYPQGRIVKQWQYVDDFSKIFGNHTIKTGFNYHRNPFTDIGNQSNNVGTITSGTLNDFYSGGGPKNNLVQVFPTTPQNDFTYNQFGAYIQDEWRLTPSLKVNAALRLDHNGNLQCASNCFSRLNSPFDSLAHTTSVPYNQVIQTGLGTAFAQIDPVLWEPRLGFAWSPKSMKGLVIRGGAGIFGDSIPLTAVVALSQNSPNLFSARGTNLPLTPGVTGGLFAATAAANAAFQSKFASGATLSQLQAAVPGFSVPRQTIADANLRTPRYYEWNLEVQKELAFSTVVSINYVGNHGIHEFVRNFGLNAFCDIANCGGFTGLPTSSPDPRFGRITQYQTTGISNYHGLTASLNKRFSHGFLFNFNYSWGHALDEISNGGRLPFIASTNASETAVSNPYNLRAQYGSADYDVRHNFTASYVWDDAVRHMFHRGPNMLFGGWIISGDFFHRTGFPFTVIDSSVSSGFQNYSGDTFAQITGPVPHSCGKSTVDTPCFADGSISSPTGFSNQGRNSFFGPNNTNFNLSVTKNFRVTERVALRIGASFYNLFNHPNFDQPDHDFAGGQNSTFGNIISTVGPPTSIFGAFVGSQNAPRDIQFRTEIRF
ncbi:MAG: carboxypeptidase regulatory-like domain-containing protein [Acidobacteriota bacterium]|nr:carboxypeptidase regulatory-like domain-containing protein [Acidobacteriota bacterium]